MMTTADMAMRVDPVYEKIHDFAGSIVVHAVGGWIALPAVVLLGARAATATARTAAFPRTRRPAFRSSRWGPGC